MFDTRGRFDVKRQAMVSVGLVMGQMGGVKSVWLKAWVAAFAFYVWAITQVAAGAATGIDFDNTLGAIPESICNAATFLQGPIGFAVVAVIFFIGLIRMLAGNRGGLGFIITAFVIGLVLLAAPEILAVFTEDGCAIGGP